MSSTCGRTRTATEPVPRVPEHPVALERTAPVRRLGRVRVPIALGLAPWATLYELPDRRVLCCLRLWEGSGPVRRCLSSATLFAYARKSGLRELEHEIARLLELRVREAHAEE
jgi:hypothetical protein